MIKDTLLTGTTGIAVNTITTDTINKVTQFTQDAVHNVDPSHLTQWTNIVIALCTLAGIVIQTFFKNRDNKNTDNE